PEPPVAFELGFVKELVERRLMREGRVGDGILDDVARLVAKDSRLDIEEHPTRVAVTVRVADGGDRTVPTVALLDFRVPLLVDRHWPLEDDVDAEVDPDLTHGGADVVERRVLVLRGIDDNNEAATAEHHLVETEVVEVAAIGEQHVA